MLRQTISTLSLLCLFALLSACGASKPEGSIRPSESAMLTPADEKIAGLYNRSCRSCHTISGSGAPLTGDTIDWQPRMAKGMDVLVENVVNGFGGMPPFGLCMDCDAQQIEALILFMAEGKKP